jgi:hypothetical protein
MKFIRFGNSLINTKIIKFVQMDLSQHNLVTLSITIKNDDITVFGSNNDNLTKFVQEYRPHKHKNYVAEAEDEFKYIEGQLKNL